MSIRLQQIESTLQRAISQVIAQRLSDPRIGGLVSITRIKVSPDLKQAFVYVSVLPEGKQALTLHGLQHAAGRIQSLLTKAVALRAVPQLEFRLDPSLKKEAEVLAAIRKANESVQDHDAPPAPAPGAAADADDDNDNDDDPHTTQVNDDDPAVLRSDDRNDTALRHGGTFARED